MAKTAVEERLTCSARALYKKVCGPRFLVNGDRTASSPASYPSSAARSGLTGLPFGPTPSTHVKGIPQREVLIQQIQGVFVIRVLRIVPEEGHKRRLLFFDLLTELSGRKIPGGNSPLVHSYISLHNAQIEK